MSSGQGENDATPQSHSPFSAFPEGRPPAQVTHGSYGVPGHPGRKTADLPENPGLPYQAARRPVKVRERARREAPRIDLALPRDARRDAHRFAAGPKRQPAPKSAPISQDSKRRGGFPPPGRRARCAQARGYSSRELKGYPINVIRWSAYQEKKYINNCNEKRFLLMLWMKPRIELFLFYANFSND